MSELLTGIYHLQNLIFFKHKARVKLCKSFGLGMKWRVAFLNIILLRHTLRKLSIHQVTMNHYNNIGTDPVIRSDDPFQDPIQIWLTPYLNCLCLDLTSSCFKH